MKYEQPGISIGILPVRVTYCTVYIWLAYGFGYGFERDWIWFPLELAWRLWFGQESDVEIVWFGKGLGYGLVWKLFGLEKGLGYGLVWKQLGLESCLHH